MHSLGTRLPASSLSVSATMRASSLSVGRESASGPRLVPGSACRRSPVVCAQSSQRDHAQGTDAGSSRRTAILQGGSLLGAILVAQPADAYQAAGLDYKQEIQRRRRKIPEDQFTEGLEGVKYYDIIPGNGAEAREGQRVVVHYDLRFRSITLFTSRQGIGVTGGSPVGFDIGQKPGEAGSILPGIDLGVRGMRVGGLRRLIVPPELAYGEKGIGDVPPNATLNIDVELLSIKTSAIGYRTKLVEG